MVKKEGIGIFLLTVVFVVCLNLVSALGVSPAIREFNFQPGGERIITYKVLGVSPTQELELSVQGDFAKYIKLDRNKLVGPGEFTAILTMPQNMETPGKTKVYLTIKEVVDEELAGTFIGTTVTVHPAIFIYVPYPGKYLEINLDGEDANVGESIEFRLDINSRGNENVTAHPSIKIQDKQNETLGVLELKEREIASQEELNLKKVLDTSSYNAGEYSALAVVSYDGNVAEDSFYFRIGELSVGVTNHSKQIEIGGLSKFDLEVESGWNDPIKGVYADVKIINGSLVFSEFRTSPVDLRPWEKKIITGFFDSNDFTAGMYDAEISLTYYGKSEQKISSSFVPVEFVEPAGGIGLVVVLIIGIVIIVGVVFLLMKFVVKGKKKSKR